VVAVRRRVRPHLAGGRQEPDRPERHRLPACAGYQLSVTNSLATCFPGVAAQLAPDLNDGLTADQVIFGSERQLSWRCPAGPDHVWRASVVYRTRATQVCPYCSNRRPSATNSLACRFPEIAAELDPALNGGRTAKRFVSGTNERVWWRCATDAGHVWPATVVSRTFSGSGCPTCATYGYSQALPGYVYLLARGDKVAERKAGISNVPAQRIRQPEKRRWRLLDLSPAFDGMLARWVEQRFLAVLAARGLRRTATDDPEERYDGYTETWRHLDLPIDTLTQVYATIDFVPETPETSAAPKSPATLKSPPTPEPPPTPDRRAPLRP
jgi:hypothetical protein